VPSELPLPAPADFTSGRSGPEVLSVDS